MCSLWFNEILSVSWNEPSKTTAACAQWLDDAVSKKGVHQQHLFLNCCNDLSISANAINDGDECSGSHGNIPDVTTHANIVDTAIVLFRSSSNFSCDVWRVSSRIRQTTNWPWTLRTSTSAVGKIWVVVPQPYDSIKWNLFSILALHRCDLSRDGSENATFTLLFCSLWSKWSNVWCFRWHILYLCSLKPSALCACSWNKESVSIYGYHAHPIHNRYNSLCC